MPLRTPNQYMYLFYFSLKKKSYAHGTPSRIPLIALNQSTKRNIDFDENPITDDSTDPHHHHQITGLHHQHSNQHDSYANYHCSDCFNSANPTATASNTDDDYLHETQVPILVVFLILTSYICIGTVIFSIWENWSLVDSAYFCFVTLSTIGFGNGDLVPRKTFHGPDLQLFACCVYLIVGLILVAMSFTLLEAQLIWKCKRMAARLKLRKD